MALLSTKIVIVGNFGTGKTSLMRRIVENTFTYNSPTTIGIEMASHSINGIPYQFWDTAGHERYRALAPMFYRTAMIAIVTFDLTDANAYEQVQSWITELNERNDSELEIIVVGTKHDLVSEKLDHRTIKEQFDKLCNENKYAYFETSSKSREGIDMLKDYLSVERKDSHLDSIDLNDSFESRSSIKLQTKYTKKTCCWL